MTKTHLPLRATEKPTKRSAVVITPNRLVLLLSLRDAESFPSQKAWAEATRSRTFGMAFQSGAQKQMLGIVASSRFWNLLEAIQRLDGTWVQRRREGSGYRCTLTARGRSIAEGRVTLQVIGLSENPAGGDKRTRAIPGVAPRSN
jgi:hypothetical protein